MTWTLLICLLAALMLALAVTFQRRADLRRQREALAERRTAEQRPNDTAPLVQPIIDLSRCLGCGTCIQSCPEDGVLDLVHGQAAVVNGAMCVGHARCVTECPVGAVSLGSGPGTERRDVPAVDDSLQAIGSDGLFLVGEITARALIRSATAQGAAVAATIATRPRSRDPEVLDLVIVGAGPGGIACALGARQHGLDFVLLDQESVIGGTVAKYPRRKLVLTEPIELPLHGRMPQREYGKEELIALWQGLVATHELPFHGGITFERCQRQPDGTYVVHTDQGQLRARQVALAVGRRGQPRRLGVPGEELPHVAYSLLDAAAYRDCEVVVVGGGDSAVEAAMALADQPGNHVTLVYRQDAFFRIRRQNRERLDERLADGRVVALLCTEVESIAPDVVAIRGNDETAYRERLAADCVFVLIGGQPPFGQLEQSGVSFDPALRPRPAVDASSGTRRRRRPEAAIVAALLVATVGFAVWHLDYYAQPSTVRAADPQHALLRPDQSLGLWFGVIAVALLLANLAYLLRRRQILRFAALTGWMSAHIVTGVGAVLLAALHSALAPRSTPGGHAFWALAALVVTGAIGRWFYAWLPRAANGRELDLAAVRQELAELRDQHRSEFAAAAWQQTELLLERRQWRSTFLGRALALVGLQWDLWRTLRRLQRHAGDGVAPAERRAVLAGVRRAHRTAVAAAHLEDLRAVLGSWRWLHRWLALLLLLLIGVHVVMAWIHGAFTFGGGL